MSGKTAVNGRRCPQCGYDAPSAEVPPVIKFRRWHIRGSGAVKAYVQSLGTETYEWLLALYVDNDFQLLAVETVDRGDVSSCHVDRWKILSRARALKAAGFVLVHNHPSGNPEPSQTDIALTVRLAHISQELDVPLLDHLIIAGDEMRHVGFW